MRLGLLAANGFVLAGIAWMVAFGPNLRASRLVPLRAAPSLGDLPALETRAGAEPTPANLTALATAYLDQGQPGLASAVVENAPRRVRELPGIAHLEARALFRRGLVNEALAVAMQASNVCAAGDCPPWLSAKTTRQVAFLTQIVAAGIDDPLADPAATRAAYERSTREVRLVAMR